MGMVFKDRNIIITGASSGIGAALAVEFASEGARLHLLARNMERLSNVAQACRSIGAQVEEYQVDMADMASIDSFCATYLDKGCGLDVLVLNAGISQRSDALSTEASVTRGIMETDFFGPVHMTTCLAGLIRSSKDFRIAVTSSISGLFGFPLRSAYCAAKHALFGYFETIEIENPQVRVTFLIPGRINTPISRSARLADGSGYGQMDPGQARGVSAEKCARKAVKAIARGKRRKLIGGVELLMVHIKRLCPSLFFFLARRVSSV